MKTKLTLNLDPDVIAKAKELAKQRNKSLSRIVQDYLHFITLDKPELNKAQDIPQDIKSISGIIKLDHDIDPKKEYREHIVEKYSK